VEFVPEYYWLFRAVHGAYLEDPAQKLQIECPPQLARTTAVENLEVAGAAIERAGQTAMLS